LTLRDSLPTGFRRTLSRLFKNQPARKPTWTPELMSWFLGHVHADAERILDYAGRDRGFWDLSDAAISERVAKSALTDRPGQHS